MNPPNRSVFAQQEPHSEAEETLRAIANLPAPAGLEERVKAGLQAAQRSGRVLHWPAIHARGNGWMQGTAARAAAAAAIVFVVVGGGWGVYSRVQLPSQSKVIVMPQRVNGAGGFSSAGAMRTPQTLNGPVLAHPVTATPKQNKAGEKGTPSASKPRRGKNTRHLAATQSAQP